MHSRRIIGARGTAPGQFTGPWGVVVWRGLLLVSENEGRRVQVLTLDGVPLQVLPLDSELRGLCASGDRVWVTDHGADKIHELAGKPATSA